MTSGKVRYLDMRKDISIHRVLALLLEDLGAVSFDVVDHWPSDPYAVGVARPADHQFLVYISTLSTTPGNYAYQCERPPIGGDIPYEADYMVDVATYSELLHAVRLHMAP